MCKTIKQAIATRDIRRKLEVMVFMIFLTRVISMIPVPGIDASVFKQWLAANSNDAFSLFSAFTGGSFENFSVFALGITPYITASIIIQLLTIAITPLANMQKNGEYGRNMIKKITVYIAVALALIQSLSMAVGFQKSGMITTNMNMYVAIAVITVSMTAGTGIMVWFSRILTKKSIGEGTSILLTANIISRLPASFTSLFREIAEGKDIKMTAVSVSIAILIIIAVIVMIIYMGDGYYPLRVQYAKKMSMSGESADTGMIPVKIGIAGVIPVIFASSLMSIPQLVAAIAGKGYGSGFSKIFLNMMSQSNWFDNENPVYGLGFLIYLALIIVFAFFYTPIVFNPKEIADSIKKQGGFIPGIRAGKETELYISNLSRRLTTIGILMLITVVVIPIAVCGMTGVKTAIGGTSLIIVVGVVLDTLQQIQLDMAGRNYSGFVVRED